MRNRPIYKAEKNGLICYINQAQLDDYIQEGWHIGEKTYNEGRQAPEFETKEKDLAYYEKDDD
jgi:hypothetical protein